MSARGQSYTRMAINFKQALGTKSIFASEITRSCSYSLYESSKHPYHEGGSIPCNTPSNQDYQPEV